MKILEVLKEKDKWSIGRCCLAFVLLFWSVTLITLTFAGVYKSDIDLGRFSIVLDKLQYAITLFASYVLGGKVVDVFKKLKTDGPK